MAAPQQRGDIFEFTHWQVLAGQAAVRFEFHCARFGRFEETISFPHLAPDLLAQKDAGLAQLFTLLHLALGVSYYKCAAATKIILPAGLGAAACRMATSLYTDGLAEFYIRAGLPFPADLQFELRQGARAPSSSSEKIQAPMLKPARANPPSAAAIVAFGGGKDSYVAQAIIEKTGLNSRLCSVVMSDKVEETIQRTAPEEVLFLRRKLDPKLRRMNDEGAFNGHVPITAINSLMLIILGRLTGAEHVLFANERSADEPTIFMGDFSANHQYSKSSDFEQRLTEAVIEADPTSPAYFSVLRPFSEIWIGRAFAHLKSPFGKFTSCNRNFQITGERAPRWCGQCAKCAFTSLILAPFLSAEETQQIFPELFLDRPTLLPIYRELCGLTENKPWDCVGTINECRASVYKLSKIAAWQNTAVATTLLPEILRENSVEQLEQFWRDGLQAQEKHFVPEAFLKAAHAL